MQNISNDTTSQNPQQTEKKANTERTKDGDDNTQDINTRDTDSQDTDSQDINTQDIYDLDGLSAFMKSELTERKGRGIPPLDKWNPEHCGSMNLVIKANGEWWHEGRKISRASLVQLFSTVLWPEDNDGERQYYLKTPVEKILIEVEDVPFLINDVNVVMKDGTPWLEFVSQTGDVIYLDEDHPIIMREYDGEMRPYITVRFGMQGLIARSVLMHLVQLGDLNTDKDTTQLELQSGGKQYQLIVPNDS